MFWFETIHPETGELIEIEAEYRAPRRGLRDRFGGPVEPDDDEELIVIGVWNRDGERVEFAKFEKEFCERGLRIVRERRGVAGFRWIRWRGLRTPSFLESLRRRSLAALRDKGCPL